MFINLHIKRSVANVRAKRASHTDKYTLLRFQIFAYFNLIKFRDLVGST